MKRRSLRLNCHRSKDATARIWDLPDPPEDQTQYAEGPTKKPLILEHTPETSEKDITSMDWSLNGEYVATGSYDAILRIWKHTGEFFWSHPQHQVCSLFRV